ncbi:hypothetical protein [Aquimarina spongiae]|uniref:Uncharacterized protein n=1 Tax=Aquimarina spongiae TaxID=570521 RepID=A0A1M6CXS3_9FLAO|nr:hypothetical protein [Aquimarina spongiae]SHI65528.1 hypothetical protein SAMN04488508_102325 [Aquimarina spongiae]
MEGNLITLSNIEKYFLKLSVLNFDDQYIADFLSLRKEDLGYVRGTLKKKFKTKNWAALIQKAFELGILKKQDYVDATVEKIALGYASKIIKDFKEISYGYQFSQDTVLDFDHTVTSTLKHLIITSK